jgi:hypothetical protein
MIRTDIFHRGIPWTRLILREGSFPDDLNLKWTQRASVGAAGLSALLGLALPWYPDRTVLAGLTVFVSGIVILNQEFLIFLARRRGIWFAVRSIPLVYAFHLYSGLSFALGVVGHVFRRGLPGAGSSNGRRPGRSHRSI